LTTARLLKYFCCFFIRAISVVYYPGLAQGGDEPGYFFCVSYLETYESPESVPLPVLKALTNRLERCFDTLDEMENVSDLCYLASLPKVLKGPRHRKGSFDDATSELTITSRQQFERRQMKNASRFGGIERFDDGVLDRLVLDSTAFRAEACDKAVWSTGVSKGYYWFR